MKYRDNIPQLKQHVALLQREIKGYERKINNCYREIAECKKAIREYPRPLKAVPAKVKQQSSIRRYKFFNQFLKANGYQGYGIVYRDRLKSGKTSVKIEGMRSRDRAIARQLCDEVSRGTSYSWDGVENSPGKFERYLFHNLPGRSK